ncbi:unnamed protein product (macronuclear) [Paramecium tetraurelia]|uniref:DIX domain-containing protein n=1 Tax=Paramecium tetraurelia TaxID=5888 RepID=A0CD73_PARTE|nr:uncharacterized protein GSPATT00006951001 [Paramecium tetraurelia]CAK68740.1 unnamed protein product [Paramecium tetraurelia]|eukprot:XP_001436137.1 hypothetical protein (macronuclear) [Paramecium tetraurelia strain d4-2]
MKSFTLIYYIVPQDNDDVEIPNAFGIGKPVDQVTLKDVKSSFPLQGEYIFRFRYKTSHNTVWLDLPTDTSQIPLFNNRILIKATRISWETQNNQSQSASVSQQLNNLAPQHIQNQTVNQQAFAQFQQPQPTQQQPQQQQQSSQNQNLIDF